MSSPPVMRVCGVQWGVKNRLSELGVWRLAGRFTTNKGKPVVYFLIKTKHRNLFLYIDFLLTFLGIWGVPFCLPFCYWNLASVIYNPHAWVAVMHSILIWALFLTLCLGLPCVCVSVSHFRTSLDLAYSSVQESVSEGKTKRPRLFSLRVRAPGPKGAQDFLTRKGCKAPNKSPLRN